ncbi:MAG: helicase [Caldilineaceae bacterium]|nr:helicase [Caldilineaceae bacterium]
MTNDLTFFTNEPGQSLLDRFKTTLKHAEFFDVLVGYFRTSGFYLLQDVLNPIDKIRILVGLNVDQQTYQIYDLARPQQEFDFEGTQRLKGRFADQLSREMEQSEDCYEVEDGVTRFVEYLRAGKIELKAHPSRNIHAKVYIIRNNANYGDFGRVLTGSSNFSYSGLQGQYEFNVELKTSADVRYALEKFEDLWAEAVDLSETYVEAIHERTWLNDTISPYELYLKFLYEYFKEDINIDLDVDFYLPPGFMDLFYQKQAVIAAKKVLDAYGGVFLADVVGLGKTYISALLAQQLPGRKLVICPPVLQEYWRTTFLEFGEGRVRVESLGKLERLQREIHNYPDRYEYVFIDEAHRFRNESTQSYEMLHDICRGKKVILVSATPLNNRIDDIFAQLKLFQSPTRSTIPGVRNLHDFFYDLNKRLAEEEKGTPEYAQTFKEVAGEVRQSVLNHVMVRRTRNEIAQFFTADMEQQGLHFPQIADPQRIVYEFDDETDAIFTQTIELLQDFRYARYTPLLYLRQGLSEFEAQSQRNVGGFMKGILVKRLESSFYAFKRSLTRFIASYEDFIYMMLEGTVLLGKNIHIWDLLDEDNEERLQELIEKGDVQKYSSTSFRDDFLVDLYHDLHILEEVKALWQDLGHSTENDPKVDQFSRELKGNPLLRNKKMLIFSESAETGRYLFQRIEEQFAGKVMFYSSSGGYCAGSSMSVATARERIEENFDPNSPAKRDDVRILITTDVLAEGINLHRSNIVVNYDLPWNPTRVLQRVGRVNRVGTEYENIYIFNFFPTAQSDEQLGLEANIKAKIQAFHDMLGEDAKYLTEEEDITQHELFGDRVYSRLNRKESYVGEEEEERSELEYLQEIRRIRDEQEALFEKIKHLPKKARTGRVGGLPGEQEGHLGDQLISFFRRGRLKKFYLNRDGSPHELTFLDAVDLLRCEPNTKRVPIPKAYYEMLTANKAAFADDSSPEEARSKPTFGSRSNVGQVIKHLKAFRRNPKYTDEDEQYMDSVLFAFQNGDVPSNRAKRIRERLQDTIDPLKVLTILHSEIPDSSLIAVKGPILELKPVEIILSAYLRPV